MMNPLASRKQAKEQPKLVFAYGETARRKNIACSDSCCARAKYPKFVELTADVVRVIL